MSLELENKISSFNAKYNVKLDPQAIAENARIESVFENFRFDKKDEKTSRATTYWKALTKTLEKSLNAKTKIKENADYDLSDFDLVSFVRKFEEIMVQSNEESSKPRERKPFEGMLFEDIIKKAKERTRAYDKPLYNIWANKIVGNKISYNDLKKITDVSIQNIENASNVSRDDLSNVVYAHEAMFRVRQSRGFWWKAFHLYQNHMEHKYLESLSTRITKYIEKNYPIEEISDAMLDSMMQKAYENTEYSIRHERNKKIEEKIQQLQKQEGEKHREISAVEEKIKPIAENPDTKEKIANEIVKKLPACIWNKTTQKTVLLAAIMNTLINETQEANKNFDDGMVYGENPQKLMLNGVRQVFQRAYLLSSTLGYSQVADQLVAAQVMTDVIMKNLSPVALEREKYAEFANSYVLNNPNKFSDITGMDSTTPAFIEAQKSYADNMNREEIEILEVKSVANNEATVPPVKQEPSINVPTFKKD